LASQALLDQVFIDGGDGTFDSVVGNTQGCSATSICQTMTPYELDGEAVTVGAASNVPAGGGADWTFVLVTSRATNFVPITSRGYAVWTLVPEPGTALLMGLGLIALSVRNRREV
jgi:hypothetical protein